MNDLLTSFPVVVLTGAGASKWLGKATTYDIYDCAEFQERCSRGPFNILDEVHGFLHRQTRHSLVDLELLLDEMRERIAEFDRLRAYPRFEGALQQAATVRDDYDEPYEQALDFMVDYYGNVNTNKPAALYGPFLQGLEDTLRSSVIPLFTLNYDEAVESAVDELADHSLVDGFGTGHRPVWSSDVFDKSAEAGYSGKCVVLFKLHGSVSWTRPDNSDRIEKTVSVPRRAPRRTHVILYPTALEKAIEQEPFTTAYGYLEAALAKASVAVLIGTSLRDAELLAVLRRTLGLAPPTLIPVGPEVDNRDIASRTGFPRDRVRAARLSFQPDQVPDLISQIKAVLTGAS